MKGLVQIMGIFKKDETKKDKKKALDKAKQEDFMMKKFGTDQKWLAIERAVEQAQEKGYMELFEKQLESQNSKLVDCPFCKKKLIVSNDRVVECTYCNKTIHALW